MLWQDVRFGFRLLRKSPGFTLAAVAALALGIGANTAVFSIVDSVLIRPLPYSQPERVGVIWENSPAQAWERISPSGPEFIEFKRQTTAFDQLALFEQGSGTLNGFGEPMQVTQTKPFLIVWSASAKCRLQTSSWHSRMLQRSWMDF